MIFNLLKKTLNVRIDIEEIFYQVKKGLTLNEANATILEGMLMKEFRQQEDKGL